MTGDQLRALRQKVRQTRYVVGEAVGLSFETIKLYERGRLPIPPVNTQKLVNYFRDELTRQDNEQRLIAHLLSDRYGIE